MPDTAFTGDDGRKVRCRACSFEWMAVGDEEHDKLWGEASAAAAQYASAQDDTAAGTDDSDTVDADRDFAEHLAEVARFEHNVATLARNARTRDIESAARDAEPERRRRLGEWRGWLAFAASLALLAFAAYQFRTPIVAQVPGTAAVYELAGIEVNIRGMAFANVTVDREFENGLPVLAVRGEIVNISARTLDIPRVRFGLRDDAETEIYHWTMAVSSGPLAPEGRARFTTKLAAPPREARDVVVRFTDPADRRTTAER